MASIGDDDLRRVVALLGGLAADSRLEDRARKARILQGLAEILGAEVYVWSQVRIGDDGRPSPFGILDGGWRSPAQRTRYFELCFSELSRPLEEALFARMGDAKFCIHRVLDLVDLNAECVTGCRSLGIEPGLLGAYRVADRVITAIEFHRLIDLEGQPGLREAMGHRELAIADLVLRALEALHVSGTDSPMTKRVEGLTERERTVLLLLMGGESRKQIARQLSLSEYTVADYIQALYRHFGVSSRAELMSLFLSGRTHTTLPGSRTVDGQA